MSELPPNVLALVAVARPALEQVAAEYRAALLAGRDIDDAQAAWRTLRDLVDRMQPSLSRDATDLLISDADDVLNDHLYSALLGGPTGIDPSWNLDDKDDR